jgi:hypothetical protein
MLEEENCTVYGVRCESHISLDCTDKTVMVQSPSAKYGEPRLDPLEYLLQKWLCGTPPTWFPRS